MLNFLLIHSKELQLGFPHRAHLVRVKLVPLVFKPQVIFWIIIIFLFFIYIGLTHHSNCGCYGVSRNHLFHSRCLGFSEIALPARDLLGLKPVPTCFFCLHTHPHLFLFAAPPLFSQGRGDLRVKVH